MNQKESHKFLTYYSLANFMTDFIEDKWANSSNNVKKVKYLTNQLKGELEKSINHIFASKETQGVDMNNVLDQFVNASYVMEKFFAIGLEMDLMEDNKRAELNDRLNKLLLEYTIDLNKYEGR
jgi:hypothetical protein